MSLQSASSCTLTILRFPIPLFAACRATTTRPSFSHSRRRQDGAYAYVVPPFSGVAHTISHLAEREARGRAHYWAARMGCRRLSRYVPRAMCLTQALAGQVLLERYGYPALVGVTKNKGTRTFQRTRVSRAMARWLSAIRGRIRAIHADGAIGLCYNRITSGLHMNPILS